MIFKNVKKRRRSLLFQKGGCDPEIKMVSCRGAGAAKCAMMMTVQHQERETFFVAFSDSPGRPASFISHFDR